MESQTNKNSNLPKIIGIAVLVVILAVVLVFLNKDKTNEGTEGTNQETNQTEETTDTTEAPDDSVDVGSVEATEELKAEINEVLNYDFTNYEIVGEDAQKYTRTFNALDTVIQLIIYSDDPNLDVEKILDETEDLIAQYEGLISKTIETSFTAQLNANSEFDYSNFAYADVVHQLIDKSTYYEELSDGVLDITMEPVVRLWDINNGNTVVPAQEDIDATLSLVGYENLSRDDAAQKYILSNGATVDFGAIAKGHMADIVKGSLMSKGINSALVNLGGNVMTIGAKPGDKNWIIGVQDPFNATGAQLGTLEVKNKSLVTSGNYERYFEVDGVRYHHILDPATGYPAVSGLAQTTIISERSIDCDALSTTTFILGADKGGELVDSMEGFDYMFVDEDGEFYYSTDFLNQYNFKETE